jgi:hypothetical protein
MAMLVMALFFFMLLACGQGTLDITGTLTPTSTPTSTRTPTLAITRTPTRQLILKVPDVTTPPPLEKYTGGEIEMRIQDMINPGNEDCVSHFPFSINWETDPPTIHGQGSVDCHFQAAGTCAVHAVMAYDVTVEGEINGSVLQAVLIFDGSLSEYFTGCPAEQPFTESNPCVWSEKGPMELMFDFMDGARVTITQVNPLPAESSSAEIHREFILHLMN